MKLNWFVVEICCNDVTLMNVDPFHWFNSWVNFNTFWTALHLNRITEITSNTDRRSCLRMLGKSNIKERIDLHLCAYRIDLIAVRTIITHRTVWVSLQALMSAPPVYYYSTSNDHCFIKRVSIRPRNHGYISIHMEPSPQQKCRFT